MSAAPTCDEDLLRRLPLPLAKLYRHAHNAKGQLDRHQSAYFLWEAALKLLGSAAVVTYAERSEHDPKLAERLTNLARPALGHWWEFVRLLAPALAETGDEGFRTVRELLLGRARDDLPRVAGLDATLRDVLDNATGARSTVRLAELFDRLVRYRNRELGHGATGQRSGEFYERMGRALLSGIPELLGRLDVLAGRQLLYIADVRRQASGNWLIERFELAGETPRRLEALDVPETEAQRLPRPERVYLAATPGPGTLAALHPLVVYDPESSEVFFLNARRGRQKGEYLCYTTGRVLEREDMGGEQRALLARILEVPVDGGQVEQWAAQSRAEEGPAPGPGEAPVRTIGEFELLSKLGQGGMGVVYRAWQPSLGREVALKCLLRSGDAKAEARFAREIRALGRVEHTHLVRVFTSGAEGDQWFYAMELIEGATLAAVCEKLQTSTPSPAQVDPKTWQEALSTVCEEARQAETPFGANIPDEARPRRLPSETPASIPLAGRSHVQHIVELMRQVAEAAHKLNEAGVIHRDVKPGNIMVNAEGSQAVLMDLGLAQLADEMEGKLTRTRQFVGTLRYASPEQVLAVDRLDRRSDVYSIGATLWELLTLRPMYGATEQTPTPELMKRIQYGEPERPRKYHPGIAADLEAVVMKCLEKDPNRRYATARDVAGDLGRWLRGEPVHAQRLTWKYVAGKFMRRHRWSIAASVGVVLLQIGLVFTLHHFFISSRTEPPEKETLQNNRTNSKHNRTRDESVPQKDKRSGGNGEKPVMGTRRALLVGCTRYLNMPPNAQLEGPGNDVVLMRKFLMDRFQFSPKKIITMSEMEGKKARTKLPTGANITGEISRLAKLAEAGDQCVIFLAGSGMRLPAQGSNPESKKLENYFLPRDAVVKGIKDPPQNAIRGKEFSALVKPIVEKKASLWMIYDACHGGFGQESEWYGGQTDKEGEAGGVVLLYAAQPNEPTSEKPLPANSPDARTHGVFTYTLCRILNQSAAPMTYVQLVQRIRAQFAAEGRHFPTPWVAGRNRYHSILGDKNWSELSQILIVPYGEGGWMVNAGSIRGLRRDTILAVKPPAGQEDGDKTVGYVRVTEVSDFRATVEPCGYGSDRIPNKLPVAGRCQPVYLDFGTLRLKLAVTGKTRSGKPAPGAKINSLTQEVKQLVEESGSLVELTKNDQAAHWMVQFDSPTTDKVYLVQGPSFSAMQGKTRGLKRVVPDIKEIIFGPILTKNIREGLLKLLNRIARSQNLMLLAGLLEEERGRSGLGLDLEIRLLRFRNEADHAGKVADWEFGRLILRQRDLIGFKIYNHSQVAVDVTLLYIDSKYGLTSFFPTKRGENRLLPGRSLITPRRKVSDAGGVQEHIVAIAVVAKGTPVNFSFLTMADLESARAAAREICPMKRTIDSPLGHLLQNAFYAKGHVRGLDMRQIKQSGCRNYLG